MKGIPAWAALPIAAAFLIELPFYLLPAFSAALLRKPGILAISCIIPYLVYSIPTGQFRMAGFAVLLILMAAVCFWYLAFPKAPMTDLCFLLLLAAIELARIFDRVYLFAPIPKLQLSTLGHVMLIRTAAIAILAIRGEVSVEYRFLPNSREWRVGLKWFVFLLPAAALALWALRLWDLRPNLNLPLAVPEFIGIFCVVALSEEFFFRGLLQQWLERWTRSSVAALIVASLGFGAAHLWVHRFPNWRYSLVAGILGLFCGLAWRETRSIQSSMVTHALAATLYRIFFI